MKDDIALLWKQLKKEEQLTQRQLDQCQLYREILQEWNKKISLTAITDIKDTIHFHIKDALQLGHFLSLESVRAIADVGSGTGVPGIILKIKYPEMSMYLIEVNKKKIAFLEYVIQQLDLSGVTICPVDWRTFIRKTSYPIDIFVARASLAPAELIRIFKPSSPYNRASLVYWAARDWQISAQEQLFVKEQFWYTIGNRKRQLVLFSL